MTNKEQRQALKRLESYTSDMRKGQIDMSECVQLSTYPPLKQQCQIKTSADSTSDIRKNKKKK